MRHCPENGFHLAKFSSCPWRCHALQFRFRITDYFVVTGALLGNFISLLNINSNQIWLRLTQTTAAQATSSFTVSAYSVCTCSVMNRQRDIPCLGKGRNTRGQTWQLFAIHAVIIAEPME